MLPCEAAGQEYIRIYQSHWGIASVMETLLLNLYQWTRFYRCVVYTLISPNPYCNCMIVCTLLKLIFFIITIPHMHTYLLHLTVICATASMMPRLLMATQV